MCPHKNCIQMIIGAFFYKGKIFKQFPCPSDDEYTVVYHIMQDYLSIKRN